MALGYKQGVAAEGRPRAHFGGEGRIGMTSGAIWLMLALACVVFETFTLEFSMVSIAIGCLAASAAWYFGVNLPGQVGVAIVGSVLGLVILAPALRRKYMPPDTQDGPASLVGQEATVLEAIEPPLEGKVKLAGTTWQALAPEVVPAGARVMVTEVDGAKLRVMPLASSGALAQGSGPLAAHQVPAAPAAPQPQATENQAS